MCVCVHAYVHVCVHACMHVCVCACACVSLGGVVVYRDTRSLPQLSKSLQNTTRCLNDHSIDVAHFVLSEL